MYDLMGKDATMFHYEHGDDPDSIGGQYVAQAQAWFDSMWATVSRDQPSKPDDRPRSIEQIIRRTRHLLLDFDGPVCSVFAGIPAPGVAEQLRDSLRSRGLQPARPRQERIDPLEVFRSCRRSSDPEPRPTAQQVLTALRDPSRPTARPTPGAADLIITAHRTGRTVTDRQQQLRCRDHAPTSADHRLSGYIRASSAGTIPTRR